MYETVYFLRFAREVTSFSCTMFLRKLEPTLYDAPIYWVQPNIMSIGKSGTWVQFTVITLAKPRKYLTLFVKINNYEFSNPRQHAYNRETAIVIGEKH